MADLLYYYCGGGDQAASELAVSLHSLLQTNPARSFEIGVGLDRQAAQRLDLDRLRNTPGVIVKVLDEELSVDAQQDPHTFHVINRWRCLQLFQYERAIILDIDTIVNRPLDRLFDQVHADASYFNTFSSLRTNDRQWSKHKVYYEATGASFPEEPLYCTIGMHAVRAGWPHVDEVISYCGAMDAKKRALRRRKVFVEEYSINLVLLRNGRKVHFPMSAIRKAKRATTTSSRCIGSKGAGARWRNPTTSISASASRFTNPCANWR